MFWIPTNVDLTGRRIEWSSTPSDVAAIALDADPKHAEVLTFRAGGATVVAIDRNSQKNCLDFWEAVVIVR